MNNYCTTASLLVVSEVGSGGASQQIFGWPAVHCSCQACTAELSKGYQYPPADPLCHSGLLRQRYVNKEFILPGSTTDCGAQYSLHWR